MRDTERIAICPGSFDPVTNGHLDLVGRASRLFDRVIVAVLVNEQKTALLSTDVRVALAREVFAPFPHVTIEQFDGLLVDVAATHSATAVVRGLRSAADFDYELPMTLMNRRLSPTLETVFLTPAPEVAAISSRLVKEVWRLGGDIDGIVPAPVARHMRALRGARQE